MVDSTQRLPGTLAIHAMWPGLAAQALSCLSPLFPKSNAMTEVKIMGKDGNILFNANGLHPDVDGVTVLVAAEQGAQGAVRAQPAAAAAAEMETGVIAWKVAPLAGSLDVPRPIAP